MGTPAWQALTRVSLVQAAVPSRGLPAGCCQQGPWGQAELISKGPGPPSLLHLTSGRRSHTDTQALWLQPRGAREDEVEVPGGCAGLPSQAPMSRAR